MSVSPIVRHLSVVFCCVSVLGSGSASAQQYPTRPIRMDRSRFRPAGNTDVLARILGQKVTEHWNQQMVIDNRPGAAGLARSLDIVAKGNSDGYTLLMGALGGGSRKEKIPQVLFAADAGSPIAPERSRGPIPASKPPA